MNSRSPLPMYAETLVIAELQTIAQDLAAIAAVAATLTTSLCIVHKVILFGNGGSAADAQHFAVELVGRDKLTRLALPALTLTTDTSALTAIGNALREAAQAHTFSWAKCACETVDVYRHILESTQ